MTRARDQLYTMAIQWGTVIKDGSGLAKFVPYISITLYEIFLNFARDVIT